MSQRRGSTRRGTSRARLAAIAASCGLACGSIAARIPWSGVQPGQPENPVYFDDAPVARQTLDRARELAASGSAGQAVRVLQRLIDESGERLLEADTDLFIPVVEHAQALLRSDAALLELYRQTEEPVARAMLEAGRFDEVVRTRLLTPSGLEAGLRLAQQRFEAGAFEASRLMLARLADHPDRTRGQGGELAHRVAWYLGREDARAWAESFAGGPAASLPTLPRDEALPATVRLGVESIDDAPAKIEVERVVSRPLHSSELVGIEERQVRQGRSESGLWIQPTVSGEVVFINDGARFGAWDRFTLSPRWRTQPEILDRMLDRLVRTQVGPSEGATGSIAVGPGVVAGVTGRATESGDWAGRVVHGLDRQTGRVLWNWHPVLEEPSLAQASPNDEVEIVEGTVVVPAMKLGSSRRLWSAYLFGLDAWTGRVKWTRLVGSAGAVPYSNTWEEIGSGGTAHRGVIYRVEGVGVIAAIEADSGRVRWARRYPGRVTWMGRDSNEASPSLTRPKPLIDGDSLIALLTSRNEVVRLDLETGEQLGRRDANMLGSPRYLVRAGDRLVAMGAVTVVTLPLESFETAPPMRGAAYPGDGFIGRAIGAPGRLLIPTRAGLLLVDPANPASSEAGFIELDRSGQVLAVEGQVLAADTQGLHSYLVWDVAERVLSRRMEERAGDPDPAMTYLELAHQAGRSERLIEAADRALSAIATLPAGEARERAGDRLFRALVWVAIDRDLRATQRETARAVIDRLGRAAHTPEQSAIHLFELGSFEDQGGAPASAVEAYQRVLEDATLAAAPYNLGGIVVPARREATRRLAELIDAHGSGLYDAVARRARDAFAAARDADAFESVARRFPAWSGTPGAWLEAAARHGQAGRAPAEIAALRAGLERARALGDRGDRAAREELAGRLLIALGEAGRETELATLMREVMDASLTLRNEGAEIMPVAFEQLIERRRSERLALPEAPRRVRTVAGVLPEWRLAFPMLEESSKPWASRALATRPGGPGKTAIGAIGVDGSGRPEIAWERSFDAPVRVVRRDADALDLLVGVNGRRRLVRLETARGAVVWQTDTIDEVLHGSGEAARAFYGSVSGEAMTPLDGAVAARDLLLHERDGTLLVVDRAGSAAAIDLQTGKAYWRARTGVGRVDAAAIAGGSVVVAGARDWSDPEGANASLLVSLDARAGERVRETSLGDERVRWMRATDDGSVIIAQEPSLARLDPWSHEATWTWFGAGADGLIDAWVVGERMYLLDASAGLLGGRLDTWVFEASVIPETAPIRSAGIVRSTLVDGGVIFASAGGVVALDERGGVIGADALDLRDRLVPAAVGNDRVVVVERVPDSDAFPRLFVLDHTGRLLEPPTDLALPPGAGPEAVAVIDGAVLVEAGHAVVVLTGAAENASADP
ncbi:MAG: PQQ-binding-like beta-propeller repeat protein [Phycisphaerales bacterium JB037]